MAKKKAHTNFATEHSPWASRDVQDVIKKTVNESTFNLLNLPDIEATWELIGELATQWCFHSLSLAFISTFISFPSFTFFLNSDPICLSFFLSSTFFHYLPLSPLFPSFVFLFLFSLSSRPFCLIFVPLFLLPSVLPLCFAFPFPLHITSNRTAYCSVFNTLTARLPLSIMRPMIGLSRLSPR